MAVELRRPGHSRLRKFQTDPLPVLDKIVFFPYIKCMIFEYDPAKSAANKDKHGIDFEEARALWQDQYALAAPVDQIGEPRTLVVARHREKSWTAVVTLRGGAVRIISVRRSRNDEVARYEKNKANAQRNIR